MSKRGEPKAAKEPANGQGHCRLHGRRPSPSFRCTSTSGAELKAMFDEVVTQPVPDKVRKLLEDLERK